MRRGKESSKTDRGYGEQRELLDARKSGPDSLVGVTEGGRAIFWLVLLLLIGAVLVAGFLGVSSG